MTSQQHDHAYHRSRVDAHIHGAIWFTVLMGVLALVVGDKFKPFQPGVRLLEPVQLVWVDDSQGWVTQQTLINAKNYPPRKNAGELLIREAYPTCVSILLVVGTIAVAYFLYACARRQAGLMNAVFADEAEQPYHRSWQELRVTFWALYAALAFVLLFFMS